MARSLFESVMLRKVVFPRTGAKTKHGLLVLSWMLAAACVVGFTQLQFAPPTPLGGLRRSAVAMRASSEADTGDPRYINQHYYTVQQKPRYAKIAAGILSGSIAAGLLSIPILALKGDLSIEHFAAQGGTVSTLQQLSAADLESETLRAGSSIDGQNWVWEYVEEDSAAQSTTAWPGSIEEADRKIAGLATLGIQTDPASNALGNAAPKTNVAVPGVQSTDRKIAGLATLGIKTDPASNTLGKAAPKTNVAAPRATLHHSKYDALTVNKNVALHKVPMARKTVKV